MLLVVNELVGAYQREDATPVQPPFDERPEHLDDPAVEDVLAHLLLYRIEGGIQAFRNLGRPAHDRFHVITRLYRLAVSGVVAPGRTRGPRVRPCSLLGLR